MTLCAWELTVRVASWAGDLWPQKDRNAFDNIILFYSIESRGEEQDLIVEPLESADRDKRLQGTKKDEGRIRERGENVHRSENEEKQREKIERMREMEQLESNWEIFHPPFVYVS